MCGARSWCSRAVAQARARVKHCTALAWNPDASLSLYDPDNAPGSDAGVPHDKTARAGFVGSGVWRRASTPHGLRRRTHARNTGCRDRSASRSEPGGDTGHTETVEPRPLRTPREECWTIRRHTVILGTEPCLSTDRGAAPDSDRLSLSVRGCVSLLRRTLSNPNRHVKSPAHSMRRVRHYMDQEKMQTGRVVDTGD